MISPTWDIARNYKASIRGWWRAKINTLTFTQFNPAITHCECAVHDLPNAGDDEDGDSDDNKNNNRSSGYHIAHHVPGTVTNT